jgi:molybdenum cofactor cytidylyltransferase
VAGEEARANDVPARQVAGVILAAGASTRMGPSLNKLLLAVEGEPMVRRLARRATEAGLSPLVVVLGHEPARVREALGGIDCTFVENAAFTGPTSGSLHAGLRALDASVTAAVVLLGDMVRVTTPMITALLETAAVGGAPLVVSRYGEEGVLAPPLLFRRALWPELLAWHGEGCGKAIVNAHRAEAAMVDWPADALRDIDTPSDYAELIGARAGD